MSTVAIPRRDHSGCRNNAVSQDAVAGQDAADSREALARQDGPVPRDHPRQPTLPMPLPRPPAPAAVTLLARARQECSDAEMEREAAPRFIASYLSALHAAAGVLAARGRPHRGRARPESVWNLLESAAPDLAEWAAFFAAHSATQAAAQAGITRRVSTDTADDLYAQSVAFVELAHRMITHGTDWSGHAGLGRSSRRGRRCPTPAARKARHA